MDVPAFARIAGVDPRTVHRWESGDARPSGASEAVLNAVKLKLEQDPASEPDFVSFLVGAAAIGGLAYLLVKLFESLGKNGGSK
jgi:hypothetical protein